MDNTYELRTIPFKLNLYRKKIEEFLSRFQLKMDRDLDYYCGIYRDQELVASGGYYKNIIKCLAVNPDIQNEGLSSKLVSHLRKEILNRGYENVMVFTKPENKMIFESFGLRTLAESAKAIILEDRIKGIDVYISKLQKEWKAGKNGGIVMNCNPFTLGHQYLVEKASSYCDHLHIFVVEEDRSQFPFEVRLDLVKKGVAHLKNVSVHRGGEYIISSATFPSYFLKEQNEIVESHTELDIDIFGKYIAPALKIGVRFVGEEPHCQVTNTYNETMRKILPKFGIEVMVIPRKQVGEQVISASYVRKLLADNQIEEIKKFVPKTTYEYLIKKNEEEKWN